MDRMSSRGGRPQDVQSEFPALVVGVGASAGGLEAFKQLLGALPSDSGMTFVLVQHLDPHHKSLLAELLTPLTQMTVQDADQGLVLKPNTVYIIRPDTALAVRGGRIELSEPTLHRGVRLPVDHLFRSLANEYGHRAVGIVLSGAGSDGSAGVRDIKAAGGLVIAQVPEASRQPGMPQSVIDAGVADLVLDIEAMPAALGRFVSLPAPSSSPPEVVEDTEPAAEQAASLSDEAMNRLAAILDAQAGFDLRVYKPATIERRALRRMALSGFESIEPYLEHLRQDPGEQQTLVRDLLISVTEFFRDLGAFQALREMVIDPMVAAAPSGSTIRAWVPACATGEEAYSIGMGFLEAIEAHNKRLTLQIFATDVDCDALAYARAAIYPGSIVEQVSQQRLHSYFKPLEGKGYQIRPRLRDVVSFAVHDLTKDPPFSRMNLVSCRNVLIYLTPAAQKHVLKALHFALEPAGHLLLSTSESTGPQRELFSTVSKTQRIYRKLGASRPIAVPHTRGKHAIAGREVPKLAESVPERPTGGDPARRAVLDAIAPPTLVVADDGTIIFSHGELGPYVRIPEGDNPRFELSSVLRSEFATRVRGALYKCRQSGEPQFALSSPDAASRRVRIGVRPAPALGSATVILTFEDLPDEAQVTVDDRSGSCEDDVLQLEKELQATREDLRNTVEELETSNEELRSSNEESMSMNEELQSTNEELEATTEELRSLNEELTTVNSQLREKVEQVEVAHDDLGNFFLSAKVATIFLDERLCIKRFTPAARELLGIDQADTGRFVADIARELLQHDLEGQANAVLNDLTAQSRDVRTSDSRWISRQVLPYRTESRRIEGVVVTFTDVTELRTANQELATKTRRLELAWEAAQGGVFEHKIPPDESTYVSDQWAQVIGYRSDELPAHDQLISWLLEQAHPDDRHLFQEAYENVVLGRKNGYNIELRFRHKAGHWIWVRKIARVLEKDEGGRPSHLLRMMIDIGDQKEVESALRETESRFREMADGLPLMVWVHDEAGNQEVVNATFCEFFGVAREEMKGGRWQILVHPDDSDSYTREFYASVAERRPFRAEARVKASDGAWRWIESWGRPRFAPDGRFCGLVGASADITERRRLEATLRDSEERFRTLADNISQLAWTCDRLGRATWYNRRWYEFTGTDWEAMQGDGWTNVHHPEHLPRVVEGLEHAVATGQPWEDTFPLLGKEGRYRWFLSRAIPIRSQSGEITRWFGTNTDVTNLRDIEQKLVQADRQKDEFLAMLGHELRNPLAAIRTASELIKVHADGNPALERPRQVLERQTLHMAKLLDGLLDIARIIRGKINLERQVLDLSAVCREVASDIEESLVRGGLEVRLDLPTGPLKIEGDPVRLAQIINNLLSNAVKYTPSGGTITLELCGKDDEAIMTVSDTGVGIDPELLPQVFEIFRQSAQSIDRAQGGLGLGLALVKTLVELHEGSIEARSEGLGRGAQFIVKLPLSHKRLDSVPADALPPSRTTEILLIEDNDDAAEMLKHLLEMSGHTVTIARDGATGLALAREKPPAIVLCDIGLPGGLSGFDVAREIRTESRLAGVRLIALSGYGRAEDKAKSEEAGFDRHLTKPVDMDALHDAIRRG